MKNKPWFRFSLKAIIFMVCVVVVDAVIGRAFSYIKDLSYSRSPQLAPTDYMVRDLDADVIVLGASIASRHYIPSMIEDSLNLSAYNCGFDGTPFLVQNSLLNLLLDRYNPKVVVWEIGENSMETGEEIKHLAYLYPYYDKNKQVQDFVNNIDDYQRYRMLSRTYRNNSTLLNELKTILSSKPSQSELALKGYMPLDTAGYKFPVKIHKDIYNSLDTPKVEILEKTLARCKDSNVLLVFSSSPRYIENYDEIQASRSYQTLLSLANKYEVPFLDFYTIFSDEPTMFKDNAHMNDNGARKYMSVFIPALKNLIN